MELKEQNILFLTRIMNFGGTENVILQLCEILKTTVNKIVVCSCGGINVEKLTEMGIKHYEIPDIAEKKISTILQTTKAIKAVLKKEKITIVHSHHRMAALYARFLCGRKIYRVANAHNTFYDKKKMTQLAYSGTKVIAVGEQVKKNLVEFFKLPETQVTMIHNAIKPFDGTIQPIAELETARNDGYILIGNIGRLCEQKGMEYFIQAASIVLEKCPKARFYIIGDGEDAKKLNTLSHELLPNGVLRFLGYRSDIQNVISQLDFVVLSSLWEGLPLTPIEAFSVGKTVVATAVDGTPEIVVNGENGMLVPSKNIEKLCESIVRVCQEDGLRERLEKCALQTYFSKFSIEILADNYEQFYANMVEKK